MAKKRAVKQVPTEESILGQEIGHLNIKVYLDGTYDIDTNIQPEFVMLYANMLADINEGKITNLIIGQYAQSKKVNEQNVAILIASFLKQLKQIGRPLITPDRVFKKKTK